MIARIQGTLLQLLPEQILVDVGGIGYQIQISSLSLESLAIETGDQIQLKTYLHIRENSQILYGFATEEEKNIFLLLIERVSGIGPSIALSILSGMQIPDFKSCVVNSDSESLSKIKGIGKKTAERIILELRDKVGMGETWQENQESLSSNAKDAELALIALGFKQAVARKILLPLLSEMPDANTEELIRIALQKK